MRTGSPRNSRVKTDANMNDAFTGWRHKLCLFDNNTGIVKYAQRCYNKRVRQAARKEIDNELSGIQA
jgi:hypothetical protein